MRKHASPHLLDTDNSISTQEVVIDEYWPVKLPRIRFPGETMGGIYPDKTSGRSSVIQPLGCGGWRCLVMHLLGHMDWRLLVSEIVAYHSIYRP